MNINYLDIIYQLNDKYNIDKIYFTEKQFINMKYRIKRQNEFNKVKEQRLKDLELAGERLWRCNLEYVSPEKKEYMFRLFRTKESLKLLKDEKSTQFFIDSTYRCVLSNYNNTKALLLIVCYKSSANRFDLCCVVLLSYENGELLIELYNHLKNIYKFSPQINNI